MESKEHANKQPVGHSRNQRGSQKIPGDKWKWKHNILKSMGHIKGSSKREGYSNISLPLNKKNLE